MENIESQKIESSPETESAETPPPVKDEWLAASLDSNLRMPQTALGIKFGLARALLKSGGSIREFAESKLSDEQVVKMREAMNKAHRAHHIPIGSDDAIDNTMAHIKKAGKTFQPAPKVITDDRLRYLWEQEKEATLDSVIKICNLFLPREEMIIIWGNILSISGGQAIEELEKDFKKHHDLKEHATSFFNDIADCLQSPEGMELARAYRKDIGLKDKPIPQTEEEWFDHRMQATISYSDLKSYVFDSVVARNPHIPKEKIAEVFH